MTLKVGAEAEYFLVRRSAEGGIEVADPLDRSALPCYDARALTRMYDHLTTVSRHINELGWANYANDHEDANGQFEQNFRYADPLTTADRVIVFRYMVHSLAAEAGMLATFMPKPFAHLTGSGLHTHLSLWGSAGEPSCSWTRATPGAWAVAARLPLHRRPAGPRPGHDRGHVSHGELLQAARARRPTRVRRGRPPTPPTGERPDPHAAGPRGRNRVENRCIDGAANPYLAFSAQIAAGLDGIIQQLDSGHA